MRRLVAVTLLGLALFQLWVVANRAVEAVYYYQGLFDKGHRILLELPAVVLGAVFLLIVACASLWNIKKSRRSSDCFSIVVSGIALAITGISALILLSLIMLPPAVIR